VSSNYHNPIPARVDDRPSLLQSAGPFQTDDVDGHRLLGNFDDVPSLLQSDGPFQTDDMDGLRVTALLLQRADGRDDVEGHLVGL
jgi:hypothetical protein